MLVLFSCVRVLVRACALLRRLGITLTRLTLADVLGTNQVLFTVVLTAQLGCSGVLFAVCV